MSDDERVIRIMCPKLTCQRILAVPESCRGQLVRCAGCTSMIRVPKVRAAGTDGADAKPAA